jgi:hypothetical protein
MTEPVSTDSATIATQRRKLLLVAFVTALPALIATVLVLTDWRPSGRSLARGELLQPVRPLPKSDWRAIGEATLESRIGEGKWLLLTVADARCDEQCERTLFAMQQARLLTHKDMRRVERVLLTHSMSAGELKSLQKKFPGLDVYQAAPDAAFRKLLLEDGRDPQAWIFLIDPLGNLVLRYAPGADTAGVHKDLLRLLKLSRIG